MNKKKKLEIFLLMFTILILLVGFISVVVVLIPIFRYDINLNNEIDFFKIGNLGLYISGTLGMCITFASIIFIYLSFRSNKIVEEEKILLNIKNSKIEKIENRFFILMKEIQDYERNVKIITKDFYEKTGKDAIEYLIKELVKKYLDMESDPIAWYKQFAEPELVLHWAIAEGSNFCNSLYYILKLIDNNELKEINSFIRIFLDIATLKFIKMCVLFEEKIYFVNHDVNTTMPPEARKMLLDYLIDIKIDFKSISKYGLYPK